MADDGDEEVEDPDGLLLEDDDEYPRDDELDEVE